jgi:hypothetical protein
MYSIKLVAEPSVSPVLLADVKAQMRIGSADTSFDTQITQLITVATKSCERYAGMAFISQQFIMALDEWPCKRKKDYWSGVREGAINTHLFEDPDEVQLPVYPLVTVDEIAQYDTDNTKHVVSSSVYTADIVSRPGRVVKNFGQIWPAYVLRPVNGIQITFTAGYGASYTSVPGDIRYAIGLYIDYLFNNGGCSEQMAVSLSGSAAILDGYRRIKV